MRSVILSGKSTFCLVAHLASLLLKVIEVEGVSVHLKQVAI